MYSDRPARAKVFFYILCSVVLLQRSDDLYSLPCIFNFAYARGKLVTLTRVFLWRLDLLCELLVNGNVVISAMLATRPYYEYINKKNRDALNTLCARRRRRHPAQHARCFIFIFYLELTCAGACAILLSFRVHFLLIVFVFICRTSIKMCSHKH